MEVSESCFLVGGSALEQCFTVSHSSAKLSKRDSVSKFADGNRIQHCVFY